jgi:histidine ammonia-lyase
MSKQTVALDGENLTLEIFMDLGKGKFYIDLTAEAWERVNRSRKVIEEILEDKNRVVYGVNAGFGSFANVVISGYHSKVLS